MTRLLNSLTELQQVLIDDSRMATVAAEHAMGKAAKVVQEDAKARIGEYQKATGPFPEWQPLAESTEAEKARHGYALDAPLLRTGDMRDSIETEHNALEAIIGSKDPVARYQEFGTDRIPPRPFLGPAVFDSREKIHKLIGDAVANVFSNNMQRIEP